MTTKHTPAPWFFRESRSNPNLLVICTKNRSEKIALTNGDEKGKANARLIAAAPKLLEALENTLEKIKDVYYNQKTLAVLTREINEIQDLIAKVKGE